MHTMILPATRILRSNADQSIRIALRILLLVLFVAAWGTPKSDVSVVATLTITPIAWNVVGLDSKNVDVGQNTFLGGGRVCNSGDVSATDVTTPFACDFGYPS